VLRWSLQHVVTGFSTSSAIFGSTLQASTESETGWAYPVEGLGIRRLAEGYFTPLRNAVEKA
jgi:hypothetical protein